MLLSFLCFFPAMVVECRARVGVVERMTSRSLFLMLAWLRAHAKGTETIKEGKRLLSPTASTEHTSQTGHPPLQRQHLLQHCLWELVRPPGGGGGGGHVCFRSVRHVCVRVFCVWVCVYDHFHGCVRWSVS